MSNANQPIDTAYLPVTSGEIWVVDPLSSQAVNVHAFLKALHAFEPERDAPLNQGALDSLKRVLRFLSTAVYDQCSTDPVELANIFNDLWRLWDMFDATSDRTPSA
ncbi:hypothetical protein [Spirosoma koreense]